jgi:hypothetical protein
LLLKGLVKFIRSEQVKAAGAVCACTVVAKRAADKMDKIYFFIILDVRSFIID